MESDALACREKFVTQMQLTCISVQLTGELTTIEWRLFVIGFLTEIRITLKECVCASKGVGGVVEKPSSEIFFANNISLNEMNVAKIANSMRLSNSKNSNNWMRLSKTI